MCLPGRQRAGPGGAQPRGQGGGLLRGACVLRVGVNTHGAGVVAVVDVVVVMGGHSSLFVTLCVTRCVRRTWHPCDATHSSPCANEIPPAS